MGISMKSVLVKAREKIANGWIQGSERDEDGNVCSVGAINWASRELAQPSSIRTHLCVEAGEVLGLAIAEVFPDHNWDGDIIDWNDYDGRTKDEVLHTFDHAIKLADRDGK